MTRNLTRQLAEFVAGTSSDDIPDAVLDRAKIILIDTVASALAGNASDEADQVQRMALAATGGGDAPVVGRHSLSAAGSVLVNGYLVTAATVCDVHRPTLCHVTPEVFPPALAIATERGVSGIDFLVSFALGLEITTRVGLGSNYAAFRANGWHSPGVWGPFGGATAGGKLLGFDPDTFVNAYGLAGSQAAGTFAHWGTPTIKFHQSRGALSGYLATLLAEQGFIASPDILTAPDGGLYGTYSDGGDPDLAARDLGQRWELEQISLRPWPLASSIQSVATALLHLIGAHSIEADDVARVRVGLSRTAYDMHGTLPWSDRFQALLSTPYVTAVILADKACWLEQFTPERIKDAAVDALARERVEVVADQTVSGTGAAVRIELRDGTIHTDVRAVPHGDASDPLSMNDVATKFNNAAWPLLDERHTESVLRRLQGIEDIDRVDSALFAALGAAE